MEISNLAGKSVLDFSLFASQPFFIFGDNPKVNAMSRRTKQTVFWSVAGSLLALIVLVLKPIPTTTNKNALTISGTVQKVFEGGEKDIVFSLLENDQIYYINRGLEQGLELSSLQSQLLGHKVQITYPDHWTPLDWNSRIHHLSRLKVGKTLLYDEINELVLTAN